MPAKQQPKSSVKPRSPAARPAAEKPTLTKKTDTRPNVLPEVDEQALKRKHAAVLKAKQTRKVKKRAASTMAEAKEDALGVVRAGLGVIPITGTVTSFIDFYYSIKKLTKSTLSAVKARHAMEARHSKAVPKKVHAPLTPLAPKSSAKPMPKFLRALAEDNDAAPVRKPSARRAQADLRKATARNARTLVRLER